MYITRTRVLNNRVCFAFSLKSRTNSNLRRPAQELTQLLLSKQAMYSIKERLGILHVHIVACTMVMLYICVVYLYSYRPASNSTVWPTTTAVWSTKISTTTTTTATIQPTTTVQPTTTIRSTSSPAPTTTSPPAGRRWRRFQDPTGICTGTGPY